MNNDLKINMKITSSDSINMKLEDSKPIDVNMSGGIVEIDPIFTHSPAYTITYNDITSWNNKSNFSGNYNDLTNKPLIPTQTSQLINNSGFITKSVSNLENYPLTSSLSSVAFSGDYSDLVNKPTIPTDTSDLTNNAGFITNAVNDLIYYTPSANLATVATSGSYNDLINKPTLANVATSGLYSDLINKPTLSTVASTGDYNDLINKPDLSDYVTEEEITYKGTNLFNINDITTQTNCTVDEDGWITATFNNTGSSTAFANLYTGVSSLLKTNTTYAIVAEVKEITGTLRDLTVSSNNAASQANTTNAIYYADLSNNSVYVKTFTTRSDFSSCTTMLRGYVSFSSGHSGSITYRISVVEDTTIDPSTFVYEPYAGGSECYKFYTRPEIDYIKKDYVKNTDYATSSVGGVVKTGNGIYLTSGGSTIGSVLTYANYGGYGNGLVISKGTLENVISGKGLVASSSLPTISAQTTAMVGYKYQYGNYVIFSGTVVISFSAGNGSLDVTGLNLASKPDSVQATICSENVGIRYDYDNSTSTSLKFILYNNNAVFNKTGNVRFSCTIYGALSS